jgi:hypothetical protein
LVSTDAGIVKVPASGGKPETVATVDPAKGDKSYHHAELLPGGRYILANSGGSIFARNNDFRATAIDVKSGNKRVLLDGVNGDAWFAPTGAKPGIGHLVYGDGGTLYAATFDANTLAVGPAVPVLEGIGGLAGGVFGFSHSGTLVYRPRGGVFSALGTQISTLIWADRQGAEQTLPYRVAPYGSPRLSPDGRRLALSVQESAGRGSPDLWVYDVIRPAPVKVASGGVTSGVLRSGPVWMPDGSRLIYRYQESDQGAPATLSVAPDGSNPLTLWPGNYIPYSLSPARVLIASTPPFGAAAQKGEPQQKLKVPSRVNKGREGARRSNNQLWLLRLGPDGKPAGEPERFLDARFFHTNAEFSPDGRWIAFQSDQNQTGEDDIFVVSFPTPGEVIPISSGGGALPRWNSNGRELFYRSGDKLMAVEVVTTGPAFRVSGAPRVLFEKAALGYDAAPGGQRFLMLKPAATEVSQRTPPVFHVILNWFEDLRRQVPLK